MTVDLRPHQIAGTTWMRMQEQNEGRKGGFIADEMGYVLPAASESNLLT